MERKILISYLDDFKQNIEDDDIDEFTDAIISLYDQKNNTKKSLENIEKSNVKLESFIREFRSNLITKLNKNQQRLERYNQTLSENKRLTRINDNLTESNDNLKAQIKEIEESMLYDNKQIKDLREDIAYYERILKKLTLIINSLEDDTYFISDSMAVDTIESSPYYRLIEGSNLFDREYYNRMYLCNEDVDEIAHYLKKGASLDYNPSMDFNTKWYKNQYMNDDKTNPLVEYLSYGINHGYLPTDYSQEELIGMDDTQEYHLIEESGLFDNKYYKSQYDVDCPDELTHYLSVGCFRDYKPSEDFDVEWYNRIYKYHESSPLLNYILNINSHLSKKADNEYVTYEDYDMSDSQLYQVISQNNLLDVSWYFTKYNSYNDDLIEDYLLHNNRFLCQQHMDYINDNPTKDVYDYIYQRLIKEYDDGFDYSRQLEVDLKDSVEYLLISESEYFDKKYYLDVYGDVKKNALDPIYHYMRYGINEGRNPSDKFNTESYYSQHQHIKNRTNPLVDYILYTNDISYDMNDLSLKDTQEYNILDNRKFFDGQYYATKYNVKSTDDLEEFMKEGIHKNRNPTEDIDIASLDVETANEYVDYIINTYIDDDKTHEKTYSNQYYENYNIIKDSIYFDEEYYRQHNPNVSEDVDAIEYYLTNPSQYTPTSKYFDVESYMQYNPDLKSAGVIPLIHFIKHGIAEGRLYKRPRLSENDFKNYPHLYELYDLIYESNLFDESYYIKNNPELLESGEDSIIHYLKYGVEYNLNPSGIFSTQRYLKFNPDIKRTGFNPLYHYLKRGKNENRLMFLPEEYYINNILEKYDFITTNKILNKLKEDTTIIIPAGGDASSFKITIQSILENTKIHYNLTIINDGKNDSESIKKILDELSQIRNICVVDSYDYEKTLKEVISASLTDVVILDKNIILTPHWLVGLTCSAYEDSHVSCVSAITNNSDLLTEDNKNKLKSIYDKNINNIDNLNGKSIQVKEKLNGLKIQRQNADKHCIYIKNEALNTIDFDEVKTDVISDISNMLYESGYIALTDASTFVYSRDNPDNEFESNKFNNIDVSRTNKIIDDILFDNKSYERILCFTTIADNTPVVDDDIRRLSNKYQTYILAVDDEKIYLFKYSNDNFSLIDNTKTDYSFDTNFFYNVYSNILINLNVDLIYTKTDKRLFHPTNRKFTSILEFKHHFEVEELHQMLTYNPSFIAEVEDLLQTHTDYDRLIDSKKNEIDFDDKKVVVYTAVTGSYDEPVIPGYVNDDFDYICFTDNPNLKSDFWQIRLMEESSLDNIRKVRSYKILPHKYLSDYDYSLWIDTNIELTDNIIDYVHKYSRNNKMLCIKHIERDCLYDEADTCITSAKDTDIDVINNQINSYRKEGYPQHNGLVSSGVLFRNHNDSQVIKVMEDWFSQLMSGSFRDQLSFNYVCWKNNFQYDSANIFIIKNSYMQLHDHLSKGFVLRSVDVGYDKDYDLKYDISDVDEILDNIEKVSVIVNVDSFDDKSKDCIDSIIKYTNVEYDLLLVAGVVDAARLHDVYAGHENVKIIESDSSSKIDNINKAINYSLNDVVIIDYHTIISPKWLQKLIVKAYSQEMIATVSAITNKDLKDTGYDFASGNIVSDARDMEQISRDTTIISPLMSNVCCYIKKDAIYASGFFDTQYDSWDYSLMDYSLRLLKKGWHNTISPSVYAYNNTISHGTTQKDSNNDGLNLPRYDNIHIASDKKQLLGRYYEYKNTIEEFNQSIEFNDIKRRASYRLDGEKSKKRILYVLHEGIGGTLHTNLELMKNVNNTMDAYLLVTSTDKVELYRYNPHTKIDDATPEMEFKNNLDLLRTWKLKTKYTLLNTSSSKLRQIYFNILVYLNIDIIHIRHMIMSTFDMPQVANKLKIPVILSFHDFYYICPSHNLVDDNKNYCGGICPPLYEDNTLGRQCNIIGELNIPQARTIVHWWRDRVAEMFGCVDAFVTTSHSAHELYTKFYPQLEKRDFRIIEHGRDLKTPDTTEYVTPINSKDKIKILFPGHIGYTKGYLLIKKIKELDVDNRLEFHYMGSIGGHKDLEEIGVNHGLYKRSEFEDIVHEVNPHFIGIFSIWPETYCHTLTEGWASGIPVLGVDIGAVAERIKANGGGFLIDNNPQKAYEKILEISDNPDEYNMKAREVTDITFKTTKQMGLDYMELYKMYLNY